MSSETTPSGPAKDEEPGSGASVGDIQGDIAQTREELASTVEALVAKTDVTGRAKQKASDTKDQVVEKAGAARHAVTETSATAARTTLDALTTDSGKPKPAVPIAAIVAVVVLVGVVVWRRRR